VFHGIIVDGELLGSTCSHFEDMTL
jgi:hypothetical protein